jgi:hypothetical protein
MTLVRASAPAARVYGIILLAEVNPTAAQGELRRLEEESTTILVRSGCLGLPQTVGDVARKVARGEYVIMTPTGKWSAEGMARSPRRLPN